MKIFVSYARADDEPFVAQLCADLTRSGIDVWWDRSRMPGRGRTFSRELEYAIDEADRFVLIVGPAAAMSSNVQKEWQYARSRCKVFNSVLRMGDFSLVPTEIAQLDVVDFRDDAHYAARVTYLLRQLKDPLIPLAPLHNVPNLPDWYVKRNKDIAGLEAALLDDALKPAPIGVRQRVTAVHGMPGIGKSMLVSALPQECDVRTHFSDGVFWISLGRQPSVSAHMRDISTAFGDDRNEYLDQERAQNRLSKLLADRSVLIILDDVWRVDHVTAFERIAGSHCRIIITTRSMLAVARLGARPFPLERLTEAQGIDLIVTRLQAKDNGTVSAHASEKTLREIVHLLGGHAQAIDIAAAQLAGRGVDYAPRLLQRLQEAFESRTPFSDLQFPDKEERLDNVEASFRVSYEDLNEASRRRFRELGAFARGEAFDLNAAAAIWNDSPSAQVKSEDALDGLVDAALLSRDAERHYRQHDLLHAYAHALLLRSRRMDAIRSRHFAYYRQLYATAIGQSNAVKRQGFVVHDFGNVQEALRWCFRQSGLRPGVNEESGIDLFRRVSEELARFQSLDQLRMLLGDAAAHALHDKRSQLWYEYYRTRLKEIDGRREEAAASYDVIASDAQAGELLKTYALIDWGRIVRSTNLGQAMQILARVQALVPEPESLPEPDAKLGSYLLDLAALHKRQGQWSESIACFERARRLFERLDDTYWMAYTDNRMKYFYFDRGMWAEGLATRARGLQLVAQISGRGQHSYLRAELLGGGSLGLAWAGAYRQTEEELREALQSAEQSGRMLQEIYLLRDLGYVLGLQGKMSDSNRYFTRGREFGVPNDANYAAITDAFQGCVAMRWSSLEDASRYLTPSLIGSIRQVSGQNFEVVKILYWLGLLSELQGALAGATTFYEECLSLQFLNEWYWHTGAWLGIARVAATWKDASRLQEAYGAIDSLLQRYAYRDYSALLSLLKGHLAWQGHRSRRRHALDKVFQSYQGALVSALHYNRFLLDEVLWGRISHALLPSIIDTCSKHGNDGRVMLQQLHDWWSNGSTDSVALPQIFNSSPAEEISLVHAEQLARAREPGDGSPQRSIIDSLYEALE